jgi:hypothetical protein
VNRARSALTVGACPSEDLCGRKRNHGDGGSRAESWMRTERQVMHPPAIRCPLRVVSLESERLRPVRLCQTHGPVLTETPRRAEGATETPSAASLPPPLVRPSSSVPSPVFSPHLQYRRARGGRTSPALCVRDFFGELNGPSVLCALALGLGAAGEEGRCVPVCVCCAVPVCVSSGRVGAVACRSKDSHSCVQACRSALVQRIIAHLGAQWILHPQTKQAPHM